MIRDNDPLIHSEPEIFHQSVFNVSIYGSLMLQSIQSFSLQINQSTSQSLHFGHKGLNFGTMEIIAKGLGWSGSI